MMLRPRRRWSTPLGSFVSSYPSDRLVADLAGIGEPVTIAAVYSWVAGRSVPRPTRAIAIVRLSGGRLTLDDVYSHRTAVDTRKEDADVAVAGSKGRMAR